MKRKIGELNNIPIVEGDPNLLKSNELLHKGGGQLSKRNKEGDIEDLAGGSSDIIYVGLKKPFLDTVSISGINQRMRDFSIGDKYTNSCYYYWGNNYGYGEEFFSKEYIIAHAIPIIPEIPSNLFYGFSFSTFKQLRLEFIKQGFTEQEFDSCFYKMSKEEFFTPSPEAIDKLTLEFDNHKLIVDFVANTYERDGEVSEITNSYVPSFSNLNSASYGEIVCNNVKYETNINNYVEYYNRFSSDVYYSGRIKVNGVGPDPNYGDVYAADGYRHSSGIIVKVIE